MSNKPGRNDPCPCGSGKKYKNCCADGRPMGLKTLAELAKNSDIRLDRASALALGDEVSMRRYRDYLDTNQISVEDAPTYMEFLGKPNMATAMNKQLQKAMAGKKFANEDEVDAFVESFMTRQNHLPREEFYGLSRAQMGDILNADSLDGISGIMCLNPEPLPEAAGEAPLPSMVAWLLGQYGESPKGLGLTATGNYRTRLVQAAKLRLYAPGDFRSDFKTEDKIPALRIAHDFLIDGEYVDEGITVSRLNGRGKALAGRNDPDALWRELFEYLLYEWTWLDAARDEMRFGDFMHIQQAGAFDMLILERAGKDYTFGKDFYRPFKKAFPFFDPEEEAGRGFSLGEIMVDHMFIDLFCANLGLVEYEPIFSENIWMQVNRRFRASPLLSAAIRWPGL